MTGIQGRAHLIFLLTALESNCNRRHLEKLTKLSVDGEMRSSKSSIDAVATPLTKILKHQRSKLDAVVRNLMCTTYEREVLSESTNVSTDVSTASPL
jgi:hypothetical protein